MKTLRYYGLDKSEYDRCRPLIDKDIAGLNYMLTCVGFVITTLLFVISLFFSQLRNFTAVYCAFSAVYLILSVCSRKKTKRYATALLYIFCCSFCVFGMLLAIRFPNDKPTIIHLAFAILPLMFADLPIRMFVYTLAMAAAYIIVGIHFQNIRLRFGEIYNAIVCSVVANVLHWIINRGRCRGYLAQVMRDEAIADLKKTQEELVRVSETDQLTGLKNRRKLYQMLAEIRAQETARPVGVYMVDVDYFKTLNDRFGHAAGDSFLNSFGRMITELEKTMNICAYRYGGEEFAILAWNGDRELLARIAENIREATAKITVGPVKNVTISVGYVFCDDPEIVNYEKWIDMADEAVYKAKEQGRDRVVCRNDM